MDSTKPDQPRVAGPLEKLAKSRKYDELEAAWLTVLEQAMLPLDDILGVLQVVARRGDAAVHETLAFYLLSLHAEKQGAEAALRLLRQVALLLPDGKVVRDEAASIYSQAVQGRPDIDSLALMTVQRQDLPLPVGVEKLERLLTLRHGQYVYDRDSRRAGAVAGVEAADGSAVLRVSFGEDTADYDAVALDRLERLEGDDIRALRVFESERLARLAQDDPEELVRMTLQTFGGRLDFKEFKVQLTDVVSAAAWGKWWNSARSVLKRSPLIQMTDERQPLLVLRREAVSYEDQFRARLRAAPGLMDKLRLALDYLAHTAAAGHADPDLLRQVLEAVRGDIEHGVDATGSELVGALALVHDIGATIDQPDAELDATLKDMLADEQGVPDLLGPMTNEDLAGRTLAFLRQAHPERWPALAAAALPFCAAAVCALIGDELARAGQNDWLKQAVDMVLARSFRHVGALLWIWRAAWGANPPPPVAALNRADMLLQLISCAGAVKRNAEGRSPAKQKQLLADIRSALSMRNYGCAGELVAAADKAHARLLQQALAQDVGLSEQLRGILMSLVERKHPDLFAEELPLWDDGHVYTTEQGLQKQNKELQYVTDVKIPANARAIGEAASRGDLSENAEWTAALEERDRLVERAAQMQAELARARIISHDTAAKDHATVGSTVHARSQETGEVEVFTFLGPWDADVSRRVLSYASPLGRAFMGRRVGETVVFNSGGIDKQWEIVELK